MRNWLIFVYMAVLLPLCTLFAPFAHAQSVTVNCDISAGTSKNLHRSFSGGFSVFANTDTLKPRLETIGASLYRVPFLRPPTVFQGTTLADTENPAKYDFSQMDMFASKVAEFGMELFATLAECPPQLTLDGTSKGAPVGQNLQIFAEVVRHIVLHYTQGWANGHYYPIRYWEIWNEPDQSSNPSVASAFWTGTQTQFFDMYAALATAIKSITPLPDQPELKVGGPAFSAAGTSWRQPFLDYCNSHALPLDFYSFHQYSDDPNVIIGAIQTSSNAVRAYSRYASTELLLNEWNMAIGPWGAGPGGLTGLDLVFYLISNPKFATADAAIHMARTLILMQRSPVDMANHFLLTDNGITTMGMVTCPEIPYPPPEPGSPAPTPGSFPRYKFYIAKAFEDFSATPDLVQANISGSGLDGLCGISTAGDEVAALLVNWGSSRTVTVDCLHLPWQYGYHWTADVINQNSFDQEVSSVRLSEGTGTGGAFHMETTFPAASVMIVHLEKDTSSWDGLPSVPIEWSIGLLALVLLFGSIGFVCLR